MDKGPRVSDFKSIEHLRATLFPKWTEEKKVKELMKDPYKYGVYCAQKDIEESRKKLGF